MRFAAGVMVVACMSIAYAQAVTLRVGPGQRLSVPSQAAAIAKDGDTVEIEAGTYRGDVAVWTQSRLTIRGRGGMARLIADGRSAESKAIWVVRGGDISIEKIEFSGARVSDHNGAGIRFEKGRLQITACRFIDNENGILTGSDPASQLDISFSEFGNNGDGSGKSHNLYVGHIARLRVVGSYFHHARIGHLLKSRAAVSIISHNRLTDESGGRASYELEFPNGGLALVLGNIIEQSATSENSIIISYGAEGLGVDSNRLVLVHNTIIDRRRFPGTPLVVRGKPGEVSVQAINNLLIDAGQLSLPIGATDRGNQSGTFDELGTDYRPQDATMWRVPPERNAVDAALASSLLQQDPWLLMSMEYKHPAQVSEVLSKTRNAGAMQSIK
ncbi:MAG: hypothetical protein JWL63_849 [Rhodocyclales bacterium]|nr:hypothetical protein [Rhodocyclales bacterium]